MYRLVALRADGVVIDVCQYPAFDVERTLVVRIPDDKLTSAFMREQHEILQRFFPNHYVLLISNSVEFLQLDPIDPSPSPSVSTEGAAWAEDGGSG